MAKIKSNKSKNKEQAKQKSAREKLREASLYTRSLIEVSLDPLVTISSEGKITDVNKATESVTGIQRDKLIGSDFSDYFTEPEKAREGYREVFEKGFVKDYPLAIRHKSGSIIHVLYNASVYKDATGHVAGVFAAARDITEQKRTEEKLREASVYTRSLIEVSLDPLITISPEGKITDVNKATESATGISREKLIGSDFSDYFTEPEKAHKGYMEVFEKGFVKDYPLAIRHVSGNTMDVLYNASVYRDTSGNIAGVFAAARDVTERKMAEKARARLTSIIEYSEDAIIGKTGEGIIFSWNPGARKIYGYKADEVIGKSISILTPPENYDEVPEILEKIKRGETIGHYESVRLRKDGQLIDVAITVSPIKDADGRITGASTITRDITKRKKMEKQLHEASLYARNLIETSLDPLVTISPEGKITDVNKATESVTGIQRDKLIGSDFSDYFTEPEKAREGYQEVFERGFVKDYPLAIRHKSGTVTHVLYNASVYKDAEGQVSGVFAAARDITERMLAEDALKAAHYELEKRVKERTSELAEANEALKAEISERKKTGESLLKSIKEKEILLKEIHHRVKNNLQIISSMLYIQSMNINDKQSITAFKEGRNRVDTMALIHEKLYQTEDLTRINFAEYIEELARNLFFFYGVNIEKTKLKIDISDIYFDVNTAIPCGLIINELVSNSLKYAFPNGRKGEIKITLKPYDDKFIMIIGDNGIGFPADMDIAETETLGLKLVNSLVNQLDGTIKLDRTSGATFEIIFSELKYKESG